MLNPQMKSWGIYELYRRQYQQQRGSGDHDRRGDEQQSGGGDYDLVDDPEDGPS